MTEAELCEYLAVNHFSDCKKVDETYSTWDVTLLVLLLAQRGLDQVVAAVDDAHARGGCLQRSRVDQGMHGAHGASLLPARSPDVARSRHRRWRS